MRGALPWLAASYTAKQGGSGWGQRVDVSLVQQRSGKHARAGADGKCWLCQSAKERGDSHESGFLQQDQPQQLCLRCLAPRGSVPTECSDRNAGCTPWVAPRRACPGPAEDLLPPCFTHSLPFRCSQHRCLCSGCMASLGWGPAAANSIPQLGAHHTSKSLQAAGFIPHQPSPSATLTPSHSIRSPAAWERRWEQSCAPCQPNRELPGAPSPFLPSPLATLTNLHLLADLYQLGHLVFQFAVAFNQVGEIRLQGLL